MAKKELTVEVSKETHELAIALVGIAAATKKALADGFQPGQDIPAIVTEAWAKLPEAIQGMDQVDDEFKESKSAFIKAIGLASADLADVIFPAKVEA